jgi:hypothetical protein
MGKVKRIESSFIVDRLQTLLPHQALLVAKIARSLVEKWSGELGDLRTGTAADAPALVDLAITLHRLGPDGKREQACLKTCLWSAHTPPGTHLIRSTTASEIPLREADGDCRAVLGEL